MTDPSNERKGKTDRRRARASVAQRMAAYYNSLVQGLEADAEGFFDRVMEIDAERRSAAVHPGSTALREPIGPR